MRDTMSCLRCGTPVTTEWVTMVTRRERLHTDVLPDGELADLYDLLGEDIEVVDGDVIAVLCPDCAPMVDAAVQSAVDAVISAVRA